MRKLPIIQDQGGYAEGLRPLSGWQKVVVCALLALILWLPLAWAALKVGSALARWRLDMAEALPLQPLPPGADSIQSAVLLQVLPVLLSFAVAIGVSAHVLARFGQLSGPREAVMAGFLNLGLVLLVAAVSGGLVWSVPFFGAALVLGITGCSCAWLGERLGERRRRRAGAQIGKSR